MKPTLYFAGTTLDAAGFEERCGQAAAALDELGVGSGDVVALMLCNEPVMLELMLAARSLGAYFCLVNWHFKLAETRHILSDSGAKILVVHAHLLGQIQGALPAGLAVHVVEPSKTTCTVFGIDANALAQARAFPSWEAHRDARVRPLPAPTRPGSMMPYTSGTTGLPKGIVRRVLSPEQLALMAQVYAVTQGIERGMRALVSAPLYHSAPASYVVQAALQDAEIWIEPRFDAERTLQMVEAERISHLYLVPTHYQRLLRLAPEIRHRYDLSSIRFVTSVGAPCPIETKERMIAWFGPVIHESYGASELGYVTHIDSEQALEKPGSAGRALDGAIVRILSEDGEELPAGRVGLIYAQSPAYPDFTYRGNDAARQALERDGLLTLGDMGYLDSDGYLFIVDRQVDMVISGGVNIYPAEIENVLATMPGVADAALFGIPDAEYGEALMAAIQLQEGARVSAEEVRSYLAARLAGYKVPPHVVFHDELPREDTGKIFKRRLRDPYWSATNRRI